METNMMRFYFIENVTSRPDLCGGMALFTTDFLRTQSAQAQISVNAGFPAFEA